MFLNKNYWFSFCYIFRLFLCIIKVFEYQIRLLLDLKFVGRQRFIKIRPFFVTKGGEGQQIMCTCTICFNFKQLLFKIQISVSDFTTSDFLDKYEDYLNEFYAFHDVEFNIQQIVKSKQEDKKKDKMRTVEIIGGGDTGSYLT